MTRRRPRYFDRGGAFLCRACRRALGNRHPRRRLRYGRRLGRVLRHDALIVIIFADVSEGVDRQIVCGGSHLPDIVLRRISDTSPGPSPPILFNNLPIGDGFCSRPLADFARIRRSPQHQPSPSPLGPTQAADSDKDRSSAQRLLFHDHPPALFLVEDRSLSPSEELGVTDRHTDAFHWVVLRKEHGMPGLDNSFFHGFKAPVTALVSKETMQRCTRPRAYPGTLK